ncbi:nucleotidyltransferase domain-containing protein [Sulfurimonas sp. RIFCSPLOWO2_12_36_12]|uniref:nucleotidyltransferase domain-containing protein n=1 Tax=Sulfurimonas sp. RIFCSPLOWO2_12_36_12 TaxID=1802253 RepID=UPI000A88CF0A|nr:nucleotidyltransferase domain-containing protein [Sulfurimonas sp. RIFCSPLOWO2_12_36_12]
MRLSAKEIRVILKTFKEVFNDGRVYLFGSRVDDNKKGGDIDLYLLPNKEYDNLQKKKVEFLLKLEELLGEQKIDVVFQRDQKRLIEEHALDKGVELKEDRLILEKYFHECDKHIQRINEAFETIQTFIPITAFEYTNLDKNQIQALDQYMFRFTKLQDTLGDKIFKLIVANYEQEVSSLPFIDILNKLEKTEYIFSAKEWMNLRKVRNNIAHQYDDEPEEMSQAINEIVSNKDVLLKIYDKVKQKYNEVF